MRLRRKVVALLLAATMIVPMGSLAPAKAADAPAMAAGRPAVVSDTLTESYLTEYTDAAFVAPGEPVAVNAIYVKQSLFDGSRLSAGDTMDSVMSGIDRGDTSQYEKFLTNISGVVAVYDFDKDSDYYVAYANTMQNDPDVSVRDWAFSVYNEQGEVLDQCVYDPDTGIAYLPKSMFNDELLTIQVQFMQVLGTSIAEAGSTVESGSPEADSNVYSTLNNLVDAETTVQAAPGMDPDDVVVFVNGIPMEERCYRYHADSGVVNIAQPAAGIGTVSVSEQSSLARKALREAFGPVTAKAAVTWDEMIVYKDVPAEIPAWVEEGMAFVGDAYLDYVDHQIHTEDDGHYGYSSSNLDDLVDVINSGNALDWDSIRLRTSQDGMIDFKLKLNNNRLYVDDDKKKDGKWMSPWGTFTLECVHTTTDLGHDADADGEYTGAMVRFFKIDRDAGYAFIGINTIKTHGQTGASLFKVAIYSVSKGKIRIEKTSADKDVTDGNDTYSLKGAVYTIKAAENIGDDYQKGDVVGKVTTDGDGIAVSEEIPFGKYTVEETTAPDGYERDPEVYEVTLADNREEGDKDDEEIVAVVHSSEKPKYGSVELNKESGFETLTGGNRCYSLKNAKYDLIAAEDIGTEYKKGDVVATLVTDEKGYAKKDNLPYGAYLVKESDASKGFRIDADRHEVTVKIGSSGKIRSEEQPYYSLGFTLYKADLDSGELIPEGDASLAGAQFTVKYYDTTEYETADDLEKAGEKAEKTWVFETKAKKDSQGNTRYGFEFSANDLVSGDALYLDDDGRAVLPLGTITVTEIKAPKGYLTDDSFFQICDKNGKPDGKKVTGTFLTKIVKDSDSAKIAAGNYLLCNEDVERGGFEIAKYDAETLRMTAQGDASLKGARFEVVNKSKNAVYVNGKRYEKDAVCLTVTTQEDAVASVDVSALPYGSYQITEVQPPEGYLLDGKLTQDFRITKDGLEVNLKDAEDAIRNRVKRGGFEIAKRDQDTLSIHPQGAASLAGAVFSLRNIGKGSVLVGGKEFGPGDVIDQLTTDDSAKTGLDVSALPYGTYELTEETPPEGYLKDGDLSEQFQIREDGVVVDLTDPDHAIRNKVMRGDFKLRKISGPTQDRIGFVTFSITSDTTGESHTFTTDIMGNYSSAKHKHSKNTNEGGVRDGLWFGRYLDDAGTEQFLAPDDEAGALPYDTYTIQECAVSDPDGNDITMNKKMLRLKLYVNEETMLVSEDGTEVEDGMIDLGNVENEDEPEPVPVTVSTSAEDSETGLQTELAQKDARITDTVRMTGLIPGETYTIQGRLINRETQAAVTDADGNEVRAEDLTFIAKAETMTKEMAYRFDAASLAGADVVVFETLLDAEGNVAAEHADLSDEDQTIHFPKIGTQAKDGRTGSKKVKAEAAVSLIDTVEYSNLLPGKVYLLTGNLMDQKTGKPAVDANGNEITASKRFSPDTADGTEEVTFTFDGSKLTPGNAYVVFETLTWRSVTVAEHADIADQDQTIDVEKEPDEPKPEEPKPEEPKPEEPKPEEPKPEEPKPEEPKIGTSAADQSDGDKELAAEADVTVVDTVSYENLKAGAHYVVRGRLMDKSSGKVVKDTETGVAITGQASFTPKKADGKQDVTFTLDTGNLVGKELVVFEKLYLQEKEDQKKLIARHEDLEDQAQTVTVAEKQKEKTVQKTAKNQSKKTTVYKDRAGSPKTGDKGILPFMILLCAAAATIIMLVGLKREKRQRMDQV